MRSQMCLGGTMGRRSGDEVESSVRGVRSVGQCQAGAAGMPHLVLLGDSVFDNARYVPDRPAVIEQVRESLPADWRATLLAVDGHVVEDVAKQLRGLPPDATHLFIS